MLPLRPGRSRARASVLALAVTAAGLAVVPPSQATAPTTQVIQVVGAPDGGGLTYAETDCATPLLDDTDVPGAVGYADTSDLGYRHMTGSRAVGYPSPAPGRARGVLAPVPDMTYLQRLTTLKESFGPSADALLVVTYLDYLGRRVQGTATVRPDAGDTAVDGTTATLTWTRFSDGTVQSLGTSTIQQWAVDRGSNNPISQARLGFLWGCDGGRTTFFDDLTLTSGDATRAYRFEGYSPSLSVRNVSRYCAVSAITYSANESFATTLSAPGYRGSSLDVRVSGPAYGASTQRLALGRRGLSIPVGGTGPITFAAPRTASTDAFSARAFVYRHPAVDVRRSGKARIYVGQPMRLSGKVTPGGRHTLRVLVARPRSAKRWRPYRATRVVRTDGRGRFTVSVRAPRPGLYAVSAMTTDGAGFTSTAARTSASFTVVRKPRPQAPPPPQPQEPTSPSVPQGPVTGGDGDGDDGGGDGGGHRTTGSPGDPAARATTRCGWRPAGRPRLARAAATAPRTVADVRRP